MKFAVSSSDGIAGATVEGIVARCHNIDNDYFDLSEHDVLLLGERLTAQSNGSLQIPLTLYHDDAMVIGSGVLQYNTTARTLYFSGVIDDKGLMDLVRSMKDSYYIWAEEIRPEPVGTTRSLNEFLTNQIGCLSLSHMVKTMTPVHVACCFLGGRVDSNACIRVDDSVQLIDRGQQHARDIKNQWMLASMMQKHFVGSKIQRLQLEADLQTDRVIAASFKKKKPVTRPTLAPRRRLGHIREEACGSLRIAPRKPAKSLTQTPTSTASAVGKKSRREAQTIRTSNKAKNKKMSLKQVFEEIIERCLVKRLQQQDPEPIEEEDSAGVPASKQQDEDVSEEENQQHQHQDSSSSDSSLVNLAEMDIPEGGLAAAPTTTAGGPSPQQSQQQPPQQPPQQIPQQHQQPPAVQVSASATSSSSNFAQQQIQHQLQMSEVSQKLSALSSGLDQLNETVINFSSNMKSLVNKQVEASFREQQEREQQQQASQQREQREAQAQQQTSQQQQAQLRTRLQLQRNNNTNNVRASAGLIPQGQATPSQQQQPQMSSVPGPSSSGNSSNGGGKMKVPLYASAMLKHRNMNPY